MPVIPFLKGKMEDFVAAIDFRLNFEDKTPSVMVKIGDVIQYDGETASYLKSNGDRVQGRTLSLKSAISVDWLKPKNAVQPESTELTASEKSTEEYDGVRGGNFETAMKQEGIAVAGTTKNQVIREKDMIVKETGNKVDRVKQAKGGKLEVAGDQMDVKAVGTSVTSSTSTFRSKKFSKEVVKSEDYGAHSTQPIHTKKSSPTPKANTYTVDDKTPSIPDMATPAEINRAKGIVIKDTESQEARVIGNVKKVATVETVDGITLKKTIAPTEINTSVKVGSGEVIQEAKTVKLSSGGTAVTDLSGKDPDGAVIVAKIGEKTDLLIPVDVKPIDGEPNYLSMLPDDWGEMHWVQKEKFIRRMVDRGFLEFLMKVETVKAIQAACEARLKELGAPKA